MKKLQNILAFTIVIWGLSGVGLYLVKLPNLPLADIWLGVLVVLSLIFIITLKKITEKKVMEKPNLTDFDVVLKDEGDLIKVSFQSPKAQDLLKSITDVYITEDSYPCIFSTSNTVDLKDWCDKNSLTYMEF